MNRLAVTYRGAAEVTGLSASGLRKEVAEGRLKAVRLGGRVLIREEDLRAWFEQRIQPYQRNAQSGESQAA